MVMDADGGEPESLGWEVFLSGIACDWSPDGRSILIGSPDGEILIVTRDGESSTFPGIDGFASGPTWSLDGDHIVFSMTLEGEQFDVYTVAADGTELMRITDSDLLEEAWFGSPDPSAFTSRGRPYRATEIVSPLNVVLSTQGLGRWGRSEIPEIRSEQVRPTRLTRSGWFPAGSTRTEGTRVGHALIAVTERRPELGGLGPCDSLDGYGWYRSTTNDVCGPPEPATPEHTTEPSGWMAMLHATA